MTQVRGPKVELNLLHLPLQKSALAVRSEPPSHVSANLPTELNRSWPSMFSTHVFKSTRVGTKSPAKFRHVHSRICGSRAPDVSGSGSNEQERQLDV